MDVIKFLSYYTLLLILFISCSKPSTDNKEEVYSISVLIDEEGIDISKNKCYLAKENLDGLTFIYFENNKSSKSFYQQKDGSFSIIEKGDTVKLLEDFSKNYEIDQNEYKVYRLIESNGQIDGDFVHFLSLDYGLLISKSLTWNQFSEIKTNCETSEMLKSIIYNDKIFLYGGKNNKEIIAPPPPPLK